MFIKDKNVDNLVLVYYTFLFYKITAIRKKRTPLSGHSLSVVECSALADFDVLHQGFLLLFGELGQRDAQDAVFHLGADFVLLHIFGQAEELFELQFVELVAQEVAVFLFLLFLFLLHHFNHQVVVAVDAQVQVLFREAGNTKLQFVILVALTHIHLRHWVMLVECAVVPIVPVQEFVEQ